MASFGKFTYHTTLTPKFDTNFAYPVLSSPPTKALKLVTLSMYNVTNTATAEMFLFIIPNTQPDLSDGTYTMAALTSFAVGVPAASLGGSSNIQPITVVGIPAKGTYGEVTMPPNSILLAMCTPTANLNGTIQWSAISYECDVEGLSSSY